MVLLVVEDVVEPLVEEPEVVEPEGGVTLKEPVMVLFPEPLEFLATNENVP